MSDIRAKYGVAVPQEIEGADAHDEEGSAIHAPRTVCVRRSTVDGLKTMRPEIVHHGTDRTQIALDDRVVDGKALRDAIDGSFQVKAGGGLHPRICDDDPHRAEVRSSATMQVAKSGASARPYSSRRGARRGIRLSRKKAKMPSAASALPKMSPDKSGVCRPVRSGIRTP